jgi:TRAP-type C4-dicarboxylate transport system permease small subunit
MERLNVSTQISEPPKPRNNGSSNTGVRILKWIDRSVLQRFEQVVMGFGLIVLSAIVFSNVIARYFFDYSPVWADELPRYMMVWITFIGMSYCVRKGEHVTMDVIFEKFSGGLKKKIYLFILIVSFVFSLFLAYQGWGLSQKVFMLKQKSVALQIPMGYIYLAIPIGSILMAKNFAHLIYKNWRSSVLITEIKEKGE